MQHDSQTSLKSHQSDYTIPQGAKIVPLNFGIKFSPPKLGLQYHVAGESINSQLVFEVHLGHFIGQNMDADQIIDMLFENHKDFINPKTIARNQISRLVDRVLSKAAPHLRRPVSQASNHVTAADDKENSALQLNNMNSQSNNLISSTNANKKGSNPLVPVSIGVEKTLE